MSDCPKSSPKPLFGPKIRVSIQMAELDFGGGGFPPPSIIKVSQTQSKIGLSTSGDVQCIGGYHEYIGKIS